MLLNAFLLALSASIDSLGVGITYGLKRTKIYFPAYLVLFILSIVITSLSISLGNMITSFISPKITRLIGSVILLGIGIFILYEATLKKEKVPKSTFPIKKEYNIFIKFLGITINIIKDPINSDMDSSNKIDMKEAIFLGIALSLDSLSIGFGASAIGINTCLFPLLISIFQIIFLSVGRFIGSNISNISKLPKNIWNIISGILLIGIGICKLFFSNY